MCLLTRVCGISIPLCYIFEITTIITKVTTPGTITITEPDGFMNVLVFEPGVGDEKLVAGVGCNLSPLQL